MTTNTTSDFALALGDPALDQDHLELQRLIEALQRAPAADVPGVMEALQAHAAKHFELEDSELRRLGGANAQCHLDEHAAVLRSLAEVRAALVQPEQPPDMIRRLVQELLRWLPEHVQAMDAGIATVRTQERLGGAPIQITRRGPAAS